MYHNPEFQERWRITGTLTTITPLRLGSGEVTEEVYKDVLKNETDGKAVKVDTLVFDAQGKPYIPATALKGNLRTWLQNRLSIENAKWLETVFGSEQPSQEAIGGKANFFDAQILQPIKNPTFPPSYWHSERQAGVAVGVTIDRVTRTALAKHLFHREIVPPEVKFSVCISGQGFTKEEVALLLAGLEGFNDKQQPVTLGSDTAQHQGRLEWQLGKIEKIDEASAKKWLEQEAVTMWHSAFQPVDSQPFYQLKSNLVTEQPTHATLRLDWQLQFDSPFLVNDPALYRQNETPAHQPKHDSKGKAILPARSMRGAIRSQAERIIRTLNEKAAGLDEAVTVEKIEQVSNLDLATQVFGGTGWKTPIHISDFILADNTGISFCQEFVAVDRFTGGGGEGLKFNAKSAYQPTFNGYWLIDLERIEPWGLGLLALVIRDLCEGDITFGFGAAKGYGHCQAVLTAWSVSGVDKVKVIEKFGLIAAEQESLRTRDEIGCQSLINRFLTAFRSKVGVTIS
jgi:CRISPR/Cas system CSM-associated protein Csm3 (group 7 of RAMP superfamily)